MKASLLSLLLPAAASARFVELTEVNRVLPFVPDEFSEKAAEQPADKYLIETAPGQTRWVTEEQKWELRRVRNPPLLTQLVRARQRRLRANAPVRLRMASVSWTLPTTTISEHTT
jgi:hypothetical protein